MPYNALLLGLIVLLFKVKQKGLRWLCGILIIGFYLQSNTYFVASLAEAWEYPVRGIDMLGKEYETGIVLSGGLVNSCNRTTGYYDLEKGSDRLLAAYFLYKKGVCKKLLLTGTDADRLLDQGRGEVQLGKALLVEWGVPEEDIILEINARNTRENALFTAEILKEAPFSTGSNLLITSSYHMRRAKGCFDKAGVAVEPFPADLGISRRCLKVKKTLVPAPDAAADFQRLWREWVGIIMYKLAGYC